MFFKNARLRAIESVMKFTGGGIFKRIDENRELLELLQRESPEFLQKHPWVNLWIESQDEFYTELAKSAQMQAPQGHEPRPYGGSTVVSARYASTSGPNENEEEDRRRKERERAETAERITAEKIMQITQSVQEEHDLRERAGNGLQLERELGFPGHPGNQQDTSA